ncbi:MAG TPA: F0F1 ATP synthase subunit B [Dehalococcoidia bacterium]|nr:F0F1 ATP synthase subunit B [Dehalococcoidia bacterium]
MDIHGITVLGIGALGINLPGLLAQLIGFAILLVIMRMVAYKPILGMMDQRSQRIREGLEAAEKMKEQATQADVTVQKRLEEARQEGQGLIGQAQQIANRLQEEARQQAQAEGESLLGRARNEIALERDDAIAQIRREFADLTIAAAEKVIGQSLDKKAHERLIEEVLAQSSLQGESAQQ